MPVDLSCTILLNKSLFDSDASERSCMGICYAPFHSVRNLSIRVRDMVPATRFLIIKEHENGNSNRT